MFYCILMLIAVALQFISYFNAKVCIDRYTLHVIFSTWSPNLDKHLEGEIHDIKNDLGSHILKGNADQLFNYSNY